MKKFIGKTTTVMNKLLNSYRTHNFYYHILMIFTIFSIVIVCLSAGISWFLLGKRYDQALRETNRKTLEQIESYTDQVFYLDTLTLLNDSFLGASSSRLNKFFLYGPQLPGSDILKEYQRVINLCNQNTYIQNITLYQKESDFLLDNTIGLRYHASRDSALAAGSLPFSTYLALTGHSSEKLLCLSAKDLPAGKRDSVTFLRSVPLYTEHAQGQGFIAIQFNEDAFLEDLKQRYPSDSGLLILSQDGVPLLETPQSGLTYEKLIETLGEDFMPKERFYQDFNYGKTRFCLTQSRSPVSGWTYLSYIPINILKADANIARQFNLMFLLLIIFFSMLVVQRLSSRIYQPISQLRMKFEPLRPLADAQDDLSAIEDAFRFLEHQVGDMKRTLERNSNILLYKVLNELLYNKDLSEPAVCSRLELCGIHFNESGYCLIVIEFERRVFYTLDMEQREYLTEKAKELVYSWFDSDFIRITESHPDNQIVTLLNLSGTQYESFLADAVKLTSFLQAQLHIAVNQAVSSYTPELVHTCRIYTEVLNALRYVFIYQYGNTFIPQQVTHMEQSDFTKQKNPHCIS